MIYNNYFEFFDITMATKGRVKIQMVLLLFHIKVGEGGIQRTRTSQFIDGEADETREAAKDGIHHSIGN